MDSYAIEGTEAFWTKNWGETLWHSAKSNEAELNICGYISTIKCILAPAKNLLVSEVIEKFGREPVFLSKPRKRERE